MAVARDHRRRPSCGCAWAVEHGRGRGHSDRIEHAWRNGFETPHGVTTSSTTSAGSSASGIIRRPPTSPISASTRSSIGARSRPASRPPTAARSISRRRWAGSPTSSAPSACERLPGHRAIGHVRYSTAGCVESPQRPADHRDVRAGPDRHRAQRQPDQRRCSSAGRWSATGAIFQSNSDTEVILHLLARAPAGPLEEQIPARWPRSRAPTPLLILTPGRHVRDARPHGFRPLTLGRLGDAWMRRVGDVRARPHGGAPERDVEPGRARGHQRRGTSAPFRAVPAGERLQCVFEYVYFARPDSVLWGRNVHTVRKALGRQLAREHPAEADIVIPVPGLRAPAPRSASPRSRARPYELGLIRNHYVGRTFIEPKQGIRHFGVEGEAQPDARRCWRASAWSWSTTRSSAAPPAARSSR